MNSLIREIDDIGRKPFIKKLYMVLFLLNGMVDFECHETIEIVK